MYSNRNNLKSSLSGSVAVGDTTVSITSGEGVLWVENSVACLEHYENDTCTKREIIKITAIVGDVLTIERGFAPCIMNDTTKEQGNTSFTFEEGDFLSMYLSKELRESFTDEEVSNQTCYDTMMNHLAVPRTCINNCLTTRQSAIDTAYRTKFGGVAGFGNGSDGDCIISEDTFLDAGREYNFRNLTICPDVLVRFEGAGVPTINVRDKFCNLGTIELKAPYVNSASILECWCASGKEVCNNPTDWGACCGGAGGKPADTAQGTYGCDGCPGTETSGGYGGDTLGCCGKPPVGLNGGRGASSCSTYYGNGGGGGGGGGGRYGNGGDGGNAGRSYCSNGSNGGNGGNSGLYGTGGKGGLGGTVCEETSMGCSGNGGNGYYGGMGGDGRGEGRAGCGGCGIIEGGKGGDADDINGDAGKGGNAITNVYGFHLNARCIYNYCVNAKGGTGGEGGYGYGKNCNDRYARGCPGGNGADGGQMIITYCKMLEEGCFDVSGGEGGLGGWTYADEGTGKCCKHRVASGCDGSDGWKALRSLAFPIVKNAAVYTFGDTKLSREDISAAPSVGVERGKTVVVYSTETYPETPEDGTLVVENTIRNQYKDTPYTLTLAEGTYYFSFFIYDAEDNLTSTAQQTLHIIGNVQYAIVGGGAGGGGGLNGGTCYGCGGGGGGGGEVLYGTTTIGGNLCTIIGQGGCGGCGELQENGCNGGDTYFGKEIAHGGGGGGAYCCVGLDGWNGGGGGSSCVGGATTGTGYVGGEGDRRGAGGGGGAFGAGSSCVFGGQGGTGKAFYFNTTDCCCCPIGGGGGGGSCVSSRSYGTGGYGGGGGGRCDGCNAPGYGGGGGGGGAGCGSIASYTNGGNGCQGAVLISYPCSCTYNITGANETFTCCSYTVHIINTDGTLCIG